MWSVYRATYSMKVSYVMYGQRQNDHDIVAKMGRCLTKDVPTMCARSECWSSCCVLVRQTAREMFYQ